MDYGSCQGDRQRYTDLGQSSRHEKGLIDGRQVAGYTHTRRERKVSLQLCDAKAT